MIEIPWYTVPLLMVLGIGTGFLWHATLDKVNESADWFEGFTEGSRLPVKACVNCDPKVRR